MEKNLPPLKQLVTLKVQNYRSIPAHAPLTIEINPHVTFVVGVNNVGKSNLLKLFYELRPVFSSFDHAIRNQTPGLADQRINIDQLAGDSLFNQKSQNQPFKMELGLGQVKMVVELRPSDPDSMHGNGYMVTWSIHGLEEITKKTDIAAQFSRLFVDSMYVGPLRTASRHASGQSRDIFIGAEFLGTFKSWAKGKIVERRNKTNELINELREIFGYQRLDISVAADDSTLIIDNDDGSFRLDELGDGIGYFIVVLANAMMKQPSIILIDEPEIGLHPKMQEAFVRSLAAKASFGMLASSHSIGLARSTADTLYSLTRGENGAPSLVPFGQHRTPTLSQSIHELGFSQMMEVGATHLLLVEGKTDIKAFREILRHFKIEQHFLIWHLGGRDTLNADVSKIADEISELKRLPFGTISVVFDSERTALNAPINLKFRPFVAHCEKLGFLVFPTDYHSTENYVTQQALDSVIGGTSKALTPYQNFNASAPSGKWDKTKNWLLFRAMKKEDFVNTGLGQFIEKTLVPAVK
ncbi:MAG: AAA family ATPase [Patescibacteria group bacterium]